MIDPAHVPTTVGPMWPFIGRQRERRIATDALRTRHDHGVVVIGPPGVGKSAFLDRLIHGGDVDEPLVTIQAEWELADEPFGAFLPEILDLLDPTPGIAPRSVDVLRALRRRFDTTDLAGATPLLRVEDVHLLDVESAAVLAQLVRSGAVEVLLTGRSTHLISPAVTRLWLDGLISRIDLVSLTAAEVREVTGRFLDGPLTFAAADALYRATLGTPRHLREVVTHALSSGNLVSREGSWTWVGDLDPGERLAEVVAATLVGRSEAARLILDLLALAGPIPTHVLAGIVDPAALGELEAEGMIATSDDSPSITSLVSPVHQEVLRTLATPAHRIDRFRTIVSPLDDNSRATILANVPATLWALESGEQLPTDHLLAAAATANLVHDYAAAERLATHAIGRETSGAASVELAYALRFLGRTDEAEDALRDLPDPVDDVAVRIAATQVWVTLAQFARDDTAEALRIADDAVASAQDDRERAALSLIRMIVAAYGEDGDDTIDDLATVVASTDLGLAGFAAASTPLAVWLAMRGEYEAATELLERVRSRATANASENRWIVEEAVSSQAFVCIQAGDVDGADDMMREMVRQLDPSVRFDRGLHQIGLARIALLRGRNDEALSEIRGAIAALEIADRSGFLAWALAIGAEAAALGDHRALAASFAERSRSTPARLSRIALVDHRRARLWSTAVNAGIDRATSDGRVLAAELRDRGLRGIELLVLHDLYRLGDVAVAPRALDLARTIAGPRAEALVSLLAAELGNDADAFLDASRSFERGGMLLFAAEAAAEAARRYDRGGLRAGRRDASMHVARLLRATGPVTSPQLGDVSTNGLTKREREIAWLASRGLTNAQIAAEIGVAPRTVEGHLHRLYSKLGVSDRAELSAHLES